MDQIGKQISSFTCPIHGAKCGMFEREYVKLKHRAIRHKNKQDLKKEIFYLEEEE